MLNIFHVTHFLNNAVVLFLLCVVRDVRKLRGETLRHTLFPRSPSWLHVWLCVSLIDSSSQAYRRAITGRDPRRWMCHHISHHPIIPSSYHKRRERWDVLWGGELDEGATDNHRERSGREIVGFYCRKLEILDFTVYTMLMTSVLNSIQFYFILFL